MIDPDAAQACLSLREGAILSRSEKRHGWIFPAACLRVRTPPAPYPLPTTYPQRRAISLAPESARKAKRPNSVLLHAQARRESFAFHRPLDRFAIG